MPTAAATSILPSHWVAPHRIDIIIDFDGTQRHGAKTDASPQVGDPDVLAAMAEHVAWGLTMPIAAIYPLEQVRTAYTELAGGHVHGKIVLSTVMPADAPPRRGRSVFYYPASPHARTRLPQAG